MKLFITEFAESKKEIERELSRHTSVIMEHLEKLVFMPKHNAVNHWEGEIYGQLCKINKLSGKNKYPSARQIYDWTWGKWGDTISLPYIRKTIKALEQEYNYKSTLTEKDFLNKLQFVGDTYFKWLSKELSESGRVTTYEVYEILDKLIEEEH